MILHLFKCIRNNLLTKVYKYVLKNKLKIAKWSDVIQTYIIDNRRGCDGFLEKFTDNIKKNKKNEGPLFQVFSITYYRVTLRTLK